MSYQYAASYATSSRDENMTVALGNLVTSSWRRFLRRTEYDGKGRPRTRLAVVRRRLWRLPTALVLLWVFVLHWGERGAFSGSIEACGWDKWEEWPSNARPHRVVLIADPQLVDPHTYPGRPWPLSSLTMTATDKYIKRSYRLLQRRIDPDTVFFLGDLFDGGREWSTHHEGFQPSEQQWKKYGDDYWLGEYNRFGKIFFDQDQITGGLPIHKGKRIVASLPGNHDLGFGNGVQVPVRNRFRAYFGESDRIDIVGNHSFVSLDTVSLSAMGQPDSPPELWNNTMLFLDRAKDLKAKAVRSELKLQQGLSPHRKLAHTVTYAHELGRQPTGDELAKESKPEFPTVVLSHVPLYRDPGFPCGPLRERSPPSAPNLDHDEPNAIRVAAGYQYQNVLTREISNTIAEKVGNVGHAFSGDDHDYCDVLHRGYPSARGGGIREITVKSISWAMGVRRPGFQLVSLWNPVDATTGEPLRGAGEPTLQTHLCLLPDQLHIFIQYAFLAVFSLAVLTLHSLLQIRNESKTAAGAGAAATNGGNSTVLPISESKSKSKSSSIASSRRTSRSRAPSTSATKLSSDGHHHHLLARSANARTRSVSPAVGYSLPITSTITSRPPSSNPLIEKAGYYGNHNNDIRDRHHHHHQHYDDSDYEDGEEDQDETDETDEWGNPFVERKPPKPKTFSRKFLDRFGFEVVSVAFPVLLVYWWLLGRG